MKTKTVFVVAIVSLFVGFYSLPIQAAEAVGGVIETGRDWIKIDRPNGKNAILVVGLPAGGLFDKDGTAITRTMFLGKIQNQTRVKAIYRDESGMIASDVISVQILP